MKKVGDALLHEAIISTGRGTVHSFLLTEASAVEIAALLEVASLEVAAAAVLERRSAVNPPVFVASESQQWPH